MIEINSVFVVKTAMAFTLYIAGAVLRLQVTKIASSAVGGDHTTVKKHIAQDKALANRYRIGLALQVAGVAVIALTTLR
jgi:hypothetical protein